MLQGNFSFLRMLLNLKQSRKIKSTVSTISHFISTTEQEGKKQDDDDESKVVNDTEETSDQAQYIPMEIEKSNESMIHPGFVTLSTDASARWKSLPDWDLIKQRNRPTEPAKKQQQAPFFLPTVSGLEPKFVLPDKDSEDGTTEKSSKFLRLNDEMQIKSKFITLLTAASISKDCMPLSATLYS